MLYNDIQRFPINHDFGQMKYFVFYARQVFYLRQVSGINYLIQMSTYRLPGDSEITWV